jgi:hypothetical protein
MAALTASRPRPRQLCMHASLYQVSPLTSDTPAVMSMHVRSMGTGRKICRNLAVIGNKRLNLIVLPNDYGMAEIQLGILWIIFSTATFSVYVTALNRTMCARCVFILYSAHAT